MGRQLGKIEFTDYLCCPECKSDLLACKECLKCKKCSKQYRVYERIPVLIDLDNLTAHLKGQVKYFERETRERAVSRFELEPCQKSFLIKFMSNAGKIKDSVVIDCGTGSGYMAIELAKRGARVIACDLTLESLIRLKQIGKECGLSDNLFLVCCTAESLPFKDGVADYFISNAVLEHLPREKEAILEIDRVTKNNARMMITVPLCYRYINPLLLPVNWLYDKRIGHLRRYDEKKLAEKFPNWAIKKSYFTGHTAKVMKVLINAGIKAFDAEGIEAEDENKQARKWGAHNIISFFAKKPTRGRLTGKNEGYH